MCFDLGFGFGLDLDDRSEQVSLRALQRETKRSLLTCSTFLRAVFFFRFERSIIDCQ